VNVTVLPQTIPFLADSIDYLLSKGVRDILLTPALGHQRVWHRESIHLLDAQIAKVSRSCRRHLRQTGRVPVRFFRRRESPRQRSEPSTRLCGAGRPDYLTVDVDGGVFGCVLFARSYQRFPDTPFGRALATLHAGALNGGTLTDDLARSTGELDATGVFDHRPAKYSSYGRCGTCAYRSDCHVCPIAIVCQPGNADPNRIPDFVCAFYRVTAKYRRRFPELSSRRLVVSRVHQHQRRNQPAT
jgi:sulfatase maturation enzyme AslB (radical SAM superfamily)